jgi:hypothetical protein
MPNVDFDLPCFFKEYKGTFDEPVFYNMIWVYENHTIGLKMAVTHMAQTFKITSVLFF